MYKKLFLGIAGIISICFLFKNVEALQDDDGNPIGRICKKGIPADKMAISLLYYPGEWFPKLIGHNAVAFEWSEDLNPPVATARILFYGKDVTPKIKTHKRKSTETDIWTKLFNSSVKTAPGIVLAAIPVTGNPGAALGLATALTQGGKTTWDESKKTSTGWAGLYSDNEIYVSDDDQIRFFNASEADDQIWTRKASWMVSKENGNKGLILAAGKVSSPPSYNGLASINTNWWGNESDNCMTIPYEILRESGVQEESLRWRSWAISPWLWSPTGEW